MIPLMMQKTTRRRAGVSLSLRVLDLAECAVTMPLMCDNAAVGSIMGTRLWHDTSSAYRGRLTLLNSNALRRRYRSGMLSRTMTLRLSVDRWRGARDR